LRSGIYGRLYYHWRGGLHHGLLRRLSVSIRAATGDVSGGGVQLRRRRRRGRMGGRGPSERGEGRVSAGSVKRRLRRQRWRRRRKCCHDLKPGNGECCLAGTRLGRGVQTARVQTKPGAGDHRAWPGPVETKRSRAKGRRAGWRSEGEAEAEQAGGSGVRRARRRSRINGAKSGGAAHPE